MASPSTSATRATSRAAYGRRDEAARLEAVFEGVVRDQTTSVVLVEGDAGIGKTRLVTDFSTLARARGADVVVGGCVDLGDEVLPYAPVVEVLGDLVRRDGAAAVARLAGPTAHELARLIPALSLGRDVPESSPASSTGLFQALCSVLDGLAASRPVVLVIEDVHWADPSTRDLLALLAHQLRGAVLILFTLRYAERYDDPAVRRFSSVLERRADAHLLLPPLSREDQARQIGDILGVPPTTPLVDDIYARADGNPFFAEELLVLGPSGDVPSTVRDLLLARLDALAPATRQVLRAAAIAGRRVPHALLHAVADIHGSRLDEALRPAVEHHVLLLDPADGGSYTFRHALLQESIAGTCLPGESVRLHRRLAEALVAEPGLAGSSRFVAGRIASHWHAAGETERALVASVAAAREAEGALAFSEALAHYERALGSIDLVPRGDALLGEPRYRLLWAAAETAHLAALPERAASLMRRAIEVVDPEQRSHYAYLHERLGRYLWMAADGDDALAAYEKAMQLIEDEPVSRWRASIFSGYSQVLMLSGRFADSRPFAEEAIRMTKAIPDGRSIEGHARNNLGIDLGMLGHIDEGIAELVEARRIAEELFEDVDDIGRALVNLSALLLDSGRLQEAADTALEAIPLIDRLGLQRRKGVWCRCDAAEALLHLGRNEDALALIREARQLAPDGIDDVRTDLVHGEVLLRLGDLDAAQEHLGRARVSGDRIVDGQIQGPLHAALVEVAGQKGELQQALALAHEGLSRLSADEDAAFCVPLFAAAASAAADACLLRGEQRGSSPGVHAESVAEVQSWVTLAEQAFARSPAASPLAAAHCQDARCELARAEGRPDPAEWGRAVMLWDEAGDPYRAVISRRRQVEAQLEGADRGAAHTVLRSAWATSRAIGAAHLQVDLENLAGRARLRLRDDEEDPKGSKAPFGLTVREREVLQLVAKGLTDRQIGQRLFISHRTVERHVSNLLAKLNASRRAELTALAHESSLVSTDDPAGG